MPAPKPVSHLALVAAFAAAACPAFASNAMDDAAIARERATQCLTLAIAYEAGFESAEGQQAVAEVILNRAVHPAYPRSVCGVVFQGSSRKTGCQFTFTCDGSMRRRLPDTVMSGARAISVAALDGVTPARVDGATHYHASYVSPYWAPSLVRIARIGAHIFYRTPGGPDPRVRTAAYVPVHEPEAGASPPASAVAALQPQRAPTAAFAPWGLSAAAVSR